MNIMNFGVPVCHILRRTTAALVAVSLGASLSACGTEKSPAQDSTEFLTAQSDSSVIAADDPWIKAVEPAGEHSMTAAFMTIRNAGDEPVGLISASVDGAQVVELHETVADEHGATVMRAIDGSLEVPAHGERVLEPGGEHIMLMQLSRGFEAGDLVDVTLVFDSGEELVVPTTVREFSGAKEEYAHLETSEHDHQENSDHGH